MYSNLSLNDTLLLGIGSVAEASFISVSRLISLSPTLVRGVLLQLNKRTLFSDDDTSFTAETKPM